MAVEPNSYLSLIDVATRVGDNGQALEITNLLSQNNEMLDDLLFTPSNGNMSHTFALRSSLPSATWRNFYQGVSSSKSTVTKATAAMGNLQALSIVDKELADLSGNASTFRIQEDMAHIEAMSQEMASAFIYGNAGGAAEGAPVTPEGFNGLAAHYSSVSTGNQSVNVIDAGGTGSDLTSVYVVCWGPTTAHAIFPKESAAGLQVEDVTPQGAMFYDPQSGGSYQAYQTKYRWMTGLVVRDWRYIVRIANVNPASPPDLLTLLTKAVYKIPTMPRTASPIQDATKSSGIPLSFGRPAIYCNRTIATALDLEAQTKTNLRLTYSEADGRPLLKFRGIPIRNVDAIVNSETQVV